MARVTPTSGRDLSAYEDGVWYTLTLEKLQRGNAKQSAFGPTIVFDFLDENGNPGPGVLASLSLNDAPGGKPAKLKGIINSLGGFAANTPVAAFDDETFAVEYEDATQDFAVEVGQQLGARGEWGAAKPGDEVTYKLVAFRPVGAQSKPAARTAPAAQPAKTAASAVPF